MIDAPKIEQPEAIAPESEPKSDFLQFKTRKQIGRGKLF